MSGEMPTRRQTLREREEGASLDRTLHEGVPAWLARPLSEWLVSRVILADWPRVGRGWTDDQRKAEKLSERALMQFRMATTDPDRTYGWHVWQFVVGSRNAVTLGMADVEPLDLLNALIELHPNWPDGRYNEADRLKQLGLTLKALEELLSNAGSAWTVDPSLRGLYRRVDPSAVEARREAEAAAKAAELPSASEHLAKAWRHAYGMAPDPSASYASSVLAVEAASCPTVLAKATASGNSIVHAVPNELRNNSKWRFVLADESVIPPGPGSPKLIADMIERLFQGQTLRHDNSNSDRNRPSTIEEARAAVHLAVVLVQLFASGAVQK